MRISCIIPSRLRPLGLRRCIESVLRTVAHPELIEFCLRIDEDDKDWFTFNDPYDIPNARIITGPHLGHAGQQSMNWELSQAATGEWLFFLNDDAEIVDDPNWTFKGWDDTLAGVPFRGFVVTPCCNVFQGQRRVWSQPTQPWHCGHFFLVPNRWWEPFGLTGFGLGSVGLSDFGRSIFTEKGVPQGMDTFTLNYLTGRGFGGDGKGSGWRIATLPMTTLHNQTEDALFKESGRKDHGTMS